MHSTRGSGLLTQEIEKAPCTGIGQGAEMQCTPVMPKRADKDGDTLCFGCYFAFSAISLSSIDSNVSMFMVPRSPLERARTATVLSSISLSPTTSM